MNVAALREKLISSEFPKEAFENSRKLWKLAKAGNFEAIQVLVDYMRVGKFDHIRKSIASNFAEEDSMLSNEEKLTIFEQGLSDDALRFWSIRGLTFLDYQNHVKLLEIALDSSISVEDRAHSVQAISRLTHQPFNRDRPKDPGNWKEQDIPVQELLDWQKSNFTSSLVIKKPKRDYSLDSPTTRFESVVSEFDRRLSRVRELDIDQNTNPSNLLIVGDQAKLSEVISRWNLPRNYQEFLARFCPFRLNCQLRIPKHENSLTLYDTDQVLRNQDDYLYSGLPANRDVDWPDNYLVIGDIFLDPIILELTSQPTIDRPILIAEHGTGTWEFEKLEDTFEKFLANIRVA